MPQNLDTLAVFHQLLYKFKVRSERAAFGGGLHVF
jgi:hypothetical protein